MESSSFYLPQDLLEEILSRLPVKSVIHFKCVKKSWSNLLQNRNFIAKHHYYRCSQTHPTLLVESMDYNIWGSPNTPRYFISLHPHPNDGDEEVERMNMAAMTTCIPSDGTIVGLPPLNFFKFFFSVYIYMCVLILAIYFNKFVLCPPNNIIDLFKGYKKLY